MTERLEEIKEIYRWAIENSIANRIADSDIEWLIQQAERVEKLELEINDWGAGKTGLGKLKRARERMLHD